MFKILWLTIRRFVVLASLVIFVSILLVPLSAMAQEIPSSIVAQNTAEDGKNLSSDVSAPSVPKATEPPNAQTSPTPQVTPTASTQRSDKPRGPEDPYEDYYEAYRKFNDEVYGEKG